MSAVRLVCVDIDGTLTEGVGGPVYDGAAAALKVLRDRYTVRLVTNTTSRSHAGLCESLRAAGVLESAAELVTPRTVARSLLPARGHDAGLLVVDDTAREDYEWFEPRERGPAVLLASEAHELRIADLQPAFRALAADGAHLYTLQQNRYFRKSGELVTDLGPVAAFLSYASGRAVENLGKPSRLLFESLARDCGVTLAEMVMVGDDAEFDASGTVRLGMQGILVRTGKYRAGDENGVDPRPSDVIDRFALLPELLRQRELQS